MPKYGFAVLMFFYLVLKTCACLTKFAMLPILKMRYKKAGEIIRQGPNFDHIMLLMAICKVSCHSHNTLVEYP